MLHLVTVVLLLAPAQVAPASGPAAGAKNAASATQPADPTSQAAPASDDQSSATSAASSEKTDAATTAEGAAGGDGAKSSAKQEASAEPTAAEKKWLDGLLHSGALGYMIEGGFFMWPILILGVFAAGVIVERYRSLKMLRTDTTAVRQEVQTLLQQDRVEEALQLCDRQQGPVPAILSSGLRKYLIMRRLNYDPAKIEEQVVKGMDDYSVHIVAALERHLPILATVSSVAPMLGFLGTVQGMVVSFDDIVMQLGKTNIVEAAAAGIKVSLLTTVLGLVVGIPAFTAFNYFTSVINRFVLEVEESASELIESVTLQMAMNRQP